MRPHWVFAFIIAVANVTSAVTARGADTSVALSAREEASIRKMPLRKKIGQLFMIGFQGTKIEAGLGDSIRDVAPGGLVVFSRNIESPRQASKLLAQAQRAAVKSSRLPLLIATDQEGGDVIRIKTTIPLPSALALGKADDPTLSERAGFAAGQLLKTLGFNMNLAPVLDVADPDQLTFIGTRTYGSDPHVVAKMGVGFSVGLAKAGVLPTGKHFPGHGGLSADSHVTMPEKNVTLDELKNHDLIPFTAMRERFGDQWAVMLGHVAYPKIDSTQTPASLSKPIINGLLRTDLGFNGLVITDDIAMGGAGKIRDVPGRVLAALDAGADMVMVAWNRKLQRDLVNSLEKAVRKGRLSSARIDQSLRRILLAKKLYAARSFKEPSDRELRLALENPAFEQVGRSLLTARFSRPADKDEDGFRDFATEKQTAKQADKQILIFSANERFLKSFRDGLPKGRRARVFHIDVNNPPDIDRIMRSNPSAVGVFYVSGYQVARVAAKVSEDVAHRMLLVTIETHSILKNASTFRYISDVYFRHPSLGKLVANYYFQPQLRAPASKTADLSRAGEL